MNTKVKSNSVVAVEQEGTRLRIIVLGAGLVEFDAERCHEANRQRAEMHGWTQRLSDAAAKSRDAKTGKPASAQVKYEAIKELAEWYMAGGDSWKRVREGGGGSGIGGNLLLMALQEAYPAKTLDELKAFLKGKSAVDKLALTQNKKLKPIMERFTAQLAGDVDLDAELEAFEEEAGSEDSSEEAEPSF